MALPTEIMDDCCKKQRCLSGDNIGKAYSICDPCGNLGEFDEELCDCISQDSRYWKLEYMFAPITNPNCIGRPNNGYCELGPLEGPYNINVSFPFGLTFSYIGVTGSWYRAYSTCGGEYGPGGLNDGGYCERTGATWVNRGQGWQTCDNASWTLNSIARIEYHGFQMITNTRSDTVYTEEVGQTGDLWILQSGPSSSGAVNCNEPQVIITSACPSDSNFDCLQE